MANNLKLANQSVNTEADALAAQFNNGYLRIYDSTGAGQPATADDAVTTQVLLAELRWNATAFGAAMDGVITANPLTPDAAANATGNVAQQSAVPAPSSGGGWYSAPSRIKKKQQRITGAAETTQAPQSVEGQGEYRPAKITGAADTKQAVQAAAGTGKESFKGAGASSQAAQSLAATGKESFSGVETGSQSPQAIAADGSVTGQQQAPPIYSSGGYYYQPKVQQEGEDEIIMLMFLMAA